MFKLSHFSSRFHLWQVKDRPCYMNSLMTESFFTMCAQHLSRCEKV